jgi:hypothetical protein
MLTQFWSVIPQWARASAAALFIQPADTFRLGCVRFSRIAFGKRDQRFDECIDRSVRYQDAPIILLVAGLPNDVHRCLVLSGRIPRLPFAL